MIQALKNKLQSLRNKVVHLIQRGVVSESAPVVPGQYPVVQISNTAKRDVQSPTFSKTTPMENISPYGLASSLPNDAIATRLNVSADSGNQVGIAYDPKTLPALQVNEVAIGNFSGIIPTYLRFTNLGTIEVWRDGIMVISDLITHVHSA